MRNASIGECAAYLAYNFWLAAAFCFYVFGGGTDKADYAVAASVLLAVITLVPLIAAPLPKPS